MVHHWTPKVLKVLPELGFVAKTKGIYWRESEPVAYVISFTKLPEELVPEELGIFCDAARRRQALRSCLDDQDKAPIVETIFDPTKSLASFAATIKFIHSASCAALQLSPTLNAFSQRREVKYGCLRKS